VICALIFFAITINYVDRLVFGILAPELQKIFGWSSADYTGIALWFEIAYAVGLTFFGRLLDWIGSRAGLALSLLGWSVAAMLHAMMSTIAGFSFARALLGLSEAGGFPGAVKTVAEWFPKKERALAAGVFNAGANVGAIVAPLAVPWLFLTYGWRWAFIGTGAAGCVWLVFWIWLYRTPDRHPRLSRAEYDYIHSDPPEPVNERLTWRQLLATRQAWSFIVGKCLSDAVWRWCLYMLPLFFSQTFQLDIRNFGAPFLVIYVMADVGSLAGGWLSSHLIKRGWSVNAARKTAMAISVAGIMPVMAAPHMSNMWVAVFLVGCATAGHQGWSSNLYTTVSDMFPKNTVASIAGIGGTFGALGALGALEITRRLFERMGPGGTTGVYSVLFIAAGFAYVGALAGAHFFAPRLQPVALPG